MPGVNLTRVIVFGLVVAPSLAQMAHAQVDGRQLQRMQQEYDAFNAARPDANNYRAGAYSGYLSGMLDALAGRGVCFRVCRCELDDRVAAWLRDHPDDLDKPAGPWLTKLLEASYPCPQ